MRQFEQKLIPISDFITLAQSQGVDFGTSDPREHLSYLSKIGLLPHTIKRKGHAGKIEGHYRPDDLKILLHIYNTKGSGISYAQMTKLAAISGSIAPFERANLYYDQANFTQSPKQHNFNQPVVYLIIGLLLGHIMTLSNSVPSFLAPKDSSNIKNIQSYALTYGNNKSNNDVYLVTLPKKNFSQLDKVKVTDLESPQK